MKTPSILAKLDQFQRLSSARTRMILFGLTKQKKIHGEKKDFGHPEGSIFVDGV